MVLQTRVKQGSPQAGFEQPEFALPRAGSVLGITGSSGSRKGPTSTHLTAPYLNMLTPTAEL